MKVVGLTERLEDSDELCVGLEVARDAGAFRVDEVFDALQQYLDLHRYELRHRGAGHVRVSMVRSVNATGQGQWRASDDCLPARREAVASF